MYRETSVCVAGHPRTAMADGGGHVAIDIADEYLALSNNRHQTTTTESERLPCIVRVPKILKNLNPQDYVPELVGLGPYHHNFNPNPNPRSHKDPDYHFNPNLNIRAHKLKALDRALRRTPNYHGSEATKEKFKDLLKELRGLVSSFKSEIKACYSEDFEFHADVFLLDAVFLLELCFSYSERMKSDRFHPLLDYRTLQTCVGFSIKRDLCKLENQIPLPLLRKLITWKGMFLPPGHNPCNFNFALMVSLFPIKFEVSNLRQRMKDKPRPKHLIHCLHRCTVKSMSNENESSKPTSAGSGSKESRRSSCSRFWKCWGNGNESSKPTSAGSNENESSKPTCAGSGPEESRRSTCSRFWKHWGNENESSKPKSAGSGPEESRRRSSCSRFWKRSGNENESSKPTSAGSGPQESHTRSTCSRFWKRWGERYVKYCSGKKKPDEEDNDWLIIPRAEELERVGIVVQVSDENKLCFKPGRFRLRGHLHLPKLWIEDSSEAMLRNLMAYEECCVEPGERFFNRYMSLMVALVQTDSDAAVLIRKGIIKNFLENSESVAHLFNRLSKFITVDTIPVFNDEIAKVREYYKSSPRVMLSEFIKTNFANPWYAAATIAAVVALGCTIVQAVYSVISA